MTCPNTKWPTKVKISVSMHTFQILYDSDKIEGSCTCQMIVNKSSTCLRLDLFSASIPISVV